MTPTQRDAASAATETVTVTVDLGDRSYPILIGSGVRAEIGPRLAAVTTTRRAAVVTNTTVGRLYLDGVVASLNAAGFEVVTVAIPDGETHKNLASLATIYDALLGARIDRSTPVLALGGGVVGSWTKGTPRSSVAAAKPATSPTTPPPRASTGVARSMRAPSNAS